MIQAIDIEVKDNIILFRYEGDDEVIYKTQKNIFKEETGVTISNPDLGIPAYIISLVNYGTSIMCGHIIDNIIGYLINAELENIFLIIDFKGVIEISENFAEQYLKFILSTKSKVLSINTNTNINNVFSEYIENMIDIQDVEQ